MGRLLVFADRPPSDVEWKGAVVWKTILGLAEAQHEVLALTTLDVAADLVDVSHSRLTVVQPAPSFSLRYLGRWLRAFMQYQPEVVHTFGLRRPGSLSSWPVLAQTVMAFPRVQRYSTVFAEEDFAPFARVSAPFDAAEFDVGGAGGLAGAVSVGPRVDLGGASEADPFAATPDSHLDKDSSDNPFILIPAPVCEWQKPILDILMLADYLENNPGVEARIVGGWGAEFGLLSRREGWSLLGPLAARVRMLPDLHFSSFVALARESRGVWLRALRPNSWRVFVSSHVAEALSLPTIGSAPQLNAGSAANFLSRLYSS